MGAGTKWRMRVSALRAAAAGLKVRAARLATRGMPDRQSHRASRDDHLVRQGSKPEGPRLRMQARFMRAWRPAERSAAGRMPERAAIATFCGRTLSALLLCDLGDDGVVALGTLPPADLRAEPSGPARHAKCSEASHSAIRARWRSHRRGPRPSSQRAPPG